MGLQLLLVTFIFNLKTFKVTFIWIQLRSFVSLFQMLIFISFLSLRVNVDLPRVLIPCISKLSHRGSIFAFPPSSQPPYIFGSCYRSWRSSMLLEINSKAQTGAVYTLYTAVCTNIQVWSRKYVAKNVKIQCRGEIQVFGSERYVKRAEIHAHIH